MFGFGWRRGSADDDGGGPPLPPGRKMRAYRDSGFGFGGGGEGRWRFRGPGPDFGKEFAKEFEKAFSFNFEHDSREPRGGRSRTRFERGDIRLVILTLLAERPMHGYEIIKEVERRFGGAFAPSPGSIYPTLQMLEDMGLVTAQQADGKKTYSITDEGREHLRQRQENVDNLWGRVGGWWRSQEADQVRALMHDFRALMTALRPAIQQLTPEQAQRLRAILEHTRHEIEAVFREPVEKAGQESAQQPEPPVPPTGGPEPGRQGPADGEPRRGMWGFGPRNF